ncbi:MAG: AAA family ATPase [Kordiimonadaceae bacterium]|nr:AAA family ATPase [Kordiimonadaceae bacterium]
MINEPTEKFFESRGIDMETLISSGIYTEGSGSSTSIVFPFLELGQVVARKFRGKDKKFWQDKGGKKTFWNADAIDAAVEYDKPLIITEGEIDALSVLEAGYSYVVSVPDGAPQQAIDDAGSVKFDYIKNNIFRLDKLRHIILAADADNPGKVLNNELQWRLGSHRCKFVTYPDGCKDFNDVLMKFGAVGVREVIDSAKDYPVKGLYTMADFPDLPTPTLYSTGLPWMDEYIQLELGRFMVLSGVPGHGKSEVADNIAYNLAQKHGWHCCIATFENPPKPHWRDKLLRKLLDCDPKFAKADRKLDGEQWIEDQFQFICQNPLSDDDDDLTIERIIELAEISVIRRGTKVLILDPWNEIEHQKAHGETETDYTSRAIRKLKRFARSYDVLVIVVAHPSKMNFGGEIKRPHLYDISGSANWYNKADYGVIVWRPDINTNVAEIHISKVKNQDYMGKPGMVELEYDTTTGKYCHHVSVRDMKSAI